MDLTPVGKFSYSPAGADILCVNTVYFMYGRMMKHLAAFLNSSLISWYVNKTTVTSGMGTARWFAVTVEAIPIPATFEDCNEVEALVNDLLHAKELRAVEKVKDLESAIEDLVFQTYGITDSEQDTIRRIKIG